MVKPKYPGYASKKMHATRYRQKTSINFSTGNDLDPNYDLCS